MSKVKVAVRVRPMNKREVDMNAECVVDMENSQTVLSSPGGSKKQPKTFAFDHCFWTIDPTNPKYASQDIVFDALGIDILDNAFDGYNACIFAYGQTGSGKSYTMMGSLSDNDTKGIIPRLCDSLFDRISKKQAADSRLTLKVEVSYMEIYCEKVKDLLSPKGTKHNLKVREHKTLGPYVEGLSKLAVSSFLNINDLMSEGNKSRTVAATQMNAESSRSHAVFSMVVTQMDYDLASQTGLEKVSKISLVDLAGSERVSKTGARGSRLKEGSLINQSLTTLGLVISSLADISAGKKGRNAYVPYRDSTLTWLLKDNLGGNSKTVMVATISPASDNFEETLSTLRYADRAKRIVNHAVVNEDPNSKIIRELREEVEKLRSMIGPGGVGSPGVGTNPKDMKDLSEKLRISESLMGEMTKTWEQRLQDTERIHQERQKALEDMGISVQAAGIGVQKDKFYLVNLNADPSMNELLVCYLKEVTRVGRPSNEGTPHQDIQLRGLGITQEHCVFEIVDGDVFLTPINTARTLVNGHRVTDRVTAKHGDRILLGNSHLFRLSCPRQQGEGEGEQEGAPAVQLMDYEAAMNEINTKELRNDPMYKKMQEDMKAKHAAEKEGSLEAQRVKYEEQLTKLREKLEQSTASSPTPPIYTTLEEEWEQRNRERLINTVIQANRLTQEANMLAEALHKDTVFKVTLTVPRSFLSPRQTLNSDEISTNNEVAIRVLHKQRGTDSVWSTETLEEKVIVMRDMYERMEEGGSPLDETLGPDPFYDLEQHALLGVANFFLDCLHHDVAHEYIAPIVAPTGNVCGHLKVAIQRVPTPLRDRELGESGEDVDYMYVVEDNADLRPGVTFSCQISVLEATGLPKEYCHYVFCQYQWWHEDDPLIIPPLVTSGQEKLSDRVQRFEHSQVFTIEVSEDFLSFIDECSLAVEVWGHRRSGFLDMGMGAGADGEPVEGKRHKSFPEKWSELTQRLELWVELMELSDQGEYIPVEMQSKPEVVTGGVFMIRQGQSRRINVAVRTVSGSGSSPLKADHIAYVSMGSIYLRNRYDEALDSYQSRDLERLRKKWSDCLMNRREYLDTEVRKIMEKKEPNVSDLERQNELLDQWAMLQWQRAAVLQPKAGSGVPGAPTNWRLVPGFESRVPVLFLDLNDDLLTPCDDDPVGAVSTGPLFGEKEESMIDLPIIKKDEHTREPRATASWDSTVHDANSLNKITGNNDRVYAILKVGVALSHPPGIVVELRKRICLRVYKRSALGAFMRAFTGKEQRTACGVMYEVVMGIPKSEGMQPPPKIPANPSFVELQEDENAVEKFKTAMTSITSILALDRLKQEVSLKEKLTKSGKSLRKRITLGEATPQSLSRADSGIIYSGSRAETPEPPPIPEEVEITSDDDDDDDDEAIMILAPPTNHGEEPATVGVSTVSLSSSPVGGEGELEAIPEEALEVGTEKVAGLDAIPEEGTSPLTCEDMTTPTIKIEGSTPTHQSKDEPRTPQPDDPSTTQEPSEGIPPTEGTSPVPPEEGATLEARPSDPSPEPVEDHTPSPLDSSSEDQASTKSDEATPTELTTPTTVSRRASELVTPITVLTTPANVSRRASEGDTTSITKTSIKKASSQPGSPKVRRAASPTPSTSSESSSLAESATPTKPPPLPCIVGEKVMVELSSGFKSGTVKFVGETEFQPGEWVGVALDRPIGKHNGTVKGVKYFKCKDKHGQFVRAGKILHNSSTGSPTTTGRTSLGKSASPLTSARKISSNPSLHTRTSYTSGTRRTGLGPKR